jgi:uncharacterized protein (DUF58 family)
MRFPAQYLRLRFGAEESAAHLDAFVACAQRAAQEVVHGMHGQRRSGAGESFWQFRPYERGDRPQDIDWRQSARGDHVFIRQRERQLAHAAWIWCAHNASMDFSSLPETLPTKQDRAQLLALSCALLMVRGGETVQMAGEAKIGRSEKQITRLASHILKTPTALLPEAENLETLSKRAFPVLIGDFLSPIEEIEATLKMCASLAHKGVVLQILDPAELNLPYEGRILFEDPFYALSPLPANRGGACPPVANVADIRQAYIQRIKTHLDLVSGLCRSLGLLHIVHVTNQAPKAALDQLYAALHEDGYRGRR